MEKAEFLKALEGVRVFKPSHGSESSALGTSLCGVCGLLLGNL